MDIEQLKLVLEMVKGLADDATSVAIWYFVLSFGLSFLSHLVVCGCVVGVFYTIASAFKSSNDDTVFVTELRDSLVPTGSGWIDSTDRMRIREAINALKAKSNG